MLYRRYWVRDIAGSLAAFGLRSQRLFSAYRSVVKSAAWRPSDVPDGNQNVGPMKIPIQLGDEVLYPGAVLLIKDRDRMIESVYRGKPAVEVVAKNILCNSIENRAAIQQAFTEGWEFFCAILPSGCPRFWLKDAKWLAAAEKIAVSIDKECLRKMPGSTVKH